MLTAFAVALSGTIYVVTTGGGGGASCNVLATTANFSTQVAATTAGQTLCLASGSYGSWSGVSKSTPGITIKEQDGATATFSALDFQSSAQWLTLDGIDYEGGTICGPANHITVKNATQTGYLSLNPGAAPLANNACGDATAMNNANILIDNIVATLSACPDGSCLGSEGRISIIFGSSSDAGITIQNSTFEGNCGDAIQLTGGFQVGRGVSIIGNEFVNLTEQGCYDVFPGPDLDAPHSDSIQFVDGCCVTISGNWFHTVSTAIVKYDGSGGNDIAVTNNVFGPSIDGDTFCLGGTGNTTVTHNTFRDGALKLCVNHDNDPNFNVTWRNNIQHQNPTIEGTSGYASGSPNYNLCTTGTCAGANSLNGTPTFTGGATPSTFAGWGLAGGSLGENAASDATDIGVVP